MIRHFLRISFRNLKKNRIYGSISIAGLAAGLAGFIIVLVYLNYELSYDKWHPELKKVYKISGRSDSDIFEQTQAPLANFLATNVANIEVASRIQAAGEYEVPVAAGEVRTYSKGSVEVDSLFLKVFPLKIVAGDASTVLNKPNAMIISREFSKKLFGNANPIGKTIKLFAVLETEVTGVFETPAGPTHMNVQFAWRSPHEKQNTFWSNRSYQTYIKTKTPVDVKQLESIINPIYYNSQLKEGDKTFEQFRADGHQAGLFADAIGRIHNFPQHGESQLPKITALLALAFLLLVVGAINFSNLAIASSIKRAKEVGIRKALGSGKLQLLGQFLGETSIQCIISLVLALVIVQILLPYFSASFGIDLSLAGFDNGLSIALQVLTCMIVVIAISGLYPAIVLTLLNTTKVLKGEYSGGRKGNTFRSALIVIQFVVASFFVFGTLVINRQIRFMETRDKGFTGAQVMRIEARQKTRDTDFEKLRLSLLEIPGVKAVAKTTTVPGDMFNDTSTVNFKHEGEIKRLVSVKVSADYFNTLDIKLVAGRLFDNRIADQTTRSVVINETAAKKLGSGNLIGKTISFDGCDSIPVEVVGVVKDFLVQRFEHSVQPVAYTIGNNSCMFQSGGAILVKIDGPSKASTLAAITSAWKTVEPELPIRYSFLDENFSILFASYIRLQKIISIFTLVAVIISAIGLFAMTANITSQRTKEIGVRKVLGATVVDIAGLLGRNFVMLVLVSILIAAPLGFWVTNEWLSTFSYRINLSWWLFGLSALGVFAIAFITIGIQTFKAARVNPINSLRSE